MSNLFLTLVIAFVIIVLALACLAIGWLITGKTKIERGACGRDPTQKKDESCQSICSLCSGPITDAEKEQNDEESEEISSTHQDVNSQFDAIKEQMKTSPLEEERSPSDEKNDQD